jgi:hypothetical protein
MSTTSAKAHLSDEEIKTEEAKNEMQYTQAKNGEVFISPLREFKYRMMVLT